ncbi:hypothetical protein M2160_005121 [Streptomyces sp. SAI-117]|uniref:hypothetical protein n=1 Tax=Streptomyces sp. SAI-117 TaxID=2940546 RepID=UPI00247592ED|nr:hypothetical protein [Streptomyces sp. SAI-117]MDH6570100.1 hypothetical protein [Streptomyces sp. SAI-117]
MRQYVHGYAPALLGLAAAAALMPAPPATGAPAAPTPTAGSCTPDGRSFPLATRIHGGPDAYEAGGGFGTWYLDLVNTTRHTCEGIHPVVVLVDERHALEPSQPRLEFYDGPRTRAVRFETTDQDELVGVFGGAGLTVGPGRTVTVKVRLAVAENAVPNEVTANAAVVQRHGDDGDWVGQSNDYRFGIGSAPGTRPDSTPTRTPGGLPFTDAAEQLASTGPAAAAAVLGTAALLLVTAGAILRARGRR